MSMRNYSRGNFEGTTRDAIDAVNRDYNARMAAVLIVIAVLLALFFISQPASAEAVCQPWSDTLSAPQYDGERNDTNVLKCTSVADCKAKMDAYMRTYGATRTSGYAYKSFQSYARCDFKPATTTPPTVTWTLCAREWTAGFGSQPGRCTFSEATAQVRFGDPASNRWSEVRTLASPVTCSLATFGSDPAPSVEKVCETSGTVVQTPVDSDSDGVPDSTDKCPTVAASTPDGCPVTPPPTGLLMSWEAPTMGIDNKPLPPDSLKGFGILYSQDLNTLGAAGLFIEVPNATAYRINLAPGTWYVAVVAMMKGGEISAMSNIRQRIVQ